MEVLVDGRTVRDDLGPISFPVLKLVSEARNEHGMRQQDWTRYRAYCTKKTHRVRSTLHLTHTDAPSGKGARSTTRQRKRRARITPDMQRQASKGQAQAFVRQSIALDSVQDARPLELLLFEAEHAWSAAEELWAQQEHTDTPRAVLRRRSLARGRRAVQCAEQLRTLADALGTALDASARAQCAAYVGLVRSAVLFIKGSWKASLQTCAVTRQLLAALAACAPTSRDEALASSFLDVLDAQVRFAAYSLGDTEQDTAAVAERVATPAVCEEVLPGYAALLEALRMAHGARGTSAQPLELHWRDQTIPVHSFELHDAITRVQAEEQQLHTYLASEASVAAPAAPARTRGGPRTRLSHAQRNAKRRGRAAGDLSRQASMQRAIHGELDPFDRVLGALSDAEEAVRLLVDENAQALQKSHSARYEAAGLDLRRAHELLVYRLLSVRIARNVRLVDEVQAKAAKREAKACALLAARLPCRPIEAAQVELQRASTKRPGPGARAKRPRATPKTVHRRPARSGTRARVRQRHAARAQRARDIAAAKTERRAVRIVPGIARLLDMVDGSLLALGGLVLVEGAPDVSSLMEAKRFYYSSVLLLHLGRAFFQHALHAEALLLVQRAELYVRQTHQALELAEGAEDQDEAFAPRLLHNRDALAAQQAQLAALRAELIAAVQTRSHPAPPVALRDTKSGQTLYHHAQRHVAFDPDHLALALQQARAHAHTAPKDEQPMDAEETTAAALEVDADVPPRAPSPRAPSLDAPAPSAYDPANALLEEEEAAAAAAKQRTRTSWLRSWFGA